MFGWLFNAVRWLVNVFSSGEEHETPRRQNEQFNYSHLEIQAGQAHLYKHQGRKIENQGWKVENQGKKVENKAQVDLFDNQWREKANEEDRLMKECYDNATLARKKGNHGTSKDYVKEAKKHQKKRDIANEKAVEWVLENNSTDFSNNSVDLHGLKVEEALKVVKKCLNTAKNKDSDEYSIITGRGKHSTNHQPKIKPRIIEYLEEENFKYEVDVDNQGLIMVYF